MRWLPIAFLPWLYCILPTLHQTARCDNASSTKQSTLFLSYEEPHKLKGLEWAASGTRRKRRRCGDGRPLETISTSYGSAGNAQQQTPWIIGSRGSTLALIQAEEMKRKIERECDREVLIKIIKTTGDKRVDVPLWEIGGKGLFTVELEEALLNREIDMCVHSSKDVPTWIADGTTLACYLKREEPNDAFISDKFKHYRDMPEGTVVGTASLRRKSQLLNLNPKLKVKYLRGNVQTRLRKMKENHVDAVVLALSGLKRLGIEECVTHIFEMTEMLPAAGQGAIVTQCREEAGELLKVLRLCSFKETEDCVSCERAFLEVLNGTCKTPIAGHAYIKHGGVPSSSQHNEGRLYFKGLVASPEGDELHTVEADGRVSTAKEIGRSAGLQLLNEVGDEFMKSIRCC